MDGPQERKPIGYPRFGQRPGYTYTSLKSPSPVLMTARSALASVTFQHPLLVLMLRLLLLMLLLLR